MQLLLWAGRCNLRALWWLFVILQLTRWLWSAWLFVFTNQRGTHRGAFLVRNFARMIEAFFCLMLLLWRETLGRFDVILGILLVESFRSFQYSTADLLKFAVLNLYNGTEFCTDFLDGILEILTKVYLSHFCIVVSENGMVTTSVILKSTITVV